MTAGARNNESLPLSAERRIDAVCMRFEAAWKAAAAGGVRPRMEDYLTAVAEEEERRALLRELVLLELHYRRGETPTVEEFGRRFPAYTELIAALFCEQAPGAPGQGVANEGVRDANDTLGEQPRAEPGQGQPPSRGALPSIPGYEILGELGRGGMGVVYEARHVLLNRPVALKMIRAGMDASEQELARFRTEAEAAARLQHPNIVQIHEVGNHQGVPYFAMEFCGGGSLEKKLNGTPLPPRVAAHLVETLARAMHAAHARGIVHRDLKPANVLLVSSDRPEAVAFGSSQAKAERYDLKITDFGLAKRLDVEVGQTQSGAILGTPSYMAPEQACGKGKEIGPAADVYALGATLYECLTGRPPFRSATLLDTILQVIGEEPGPPRALEPGVPRDLETICLQAMAKAPAQRYPSAHDLAEDLARFLGGRPIRARPVGPLGRCWRWCRRNPALAGLSAVAASLMAAVFLLLPPTDDSLGRIQRAGELVIATDPSNAPMEFEENGERKGFDIELASRLAEQLGVRAQFVEVSWNWGSLTRRLDSREFDVVISGVTITPEREADAAFVEYLSMRLVYVCHEGMPFDPNKDPFAGKKVAVQADTPAARHVEELQGQDIPRTVHLLPDVDSVMVAVGTGQDDVTLAHEPIVKYYTRKYPTLKVLDSVRPEVDPEKVGIVLRKRDKALRAAVEEKIKLMRRDKTFDMLLDRWFGKK